MTALLLAGILSPGNLATSNCLLQWVAVGQCLLYLAGSEVLRLGGGVASSARSSAKWDLLAVHDQGHNRMESTVEGFYMMFLTKSLPACCRSVCQAVHHHGW